MLSQSLDLNHDLGFKFIKKNSSRHQAIMITYADYTDDLVILTDSLKDATSLIHKIEEVSKELGLQINTGKTEYTSFNKAIT